MTRGRRSAMRMTWRTYSVDEDDQLTVYWFRKELDWRTGYVASALGVEGLSHEYVDVLGTADEITGWTAAATVYVDEVALAVAELNRVKWRTWRWRRRPLVRRSADAKYNEAKARYLQRVRAAVSVYQPVRDVIEQRVAEQEAIRLAEAERSRREWERRQREAEARFEAWQQRQAGSHDSVRNEQARAEAVRTVIEGITATAAVLEKAGRPGRAVIDDKPREVLHGWWVDFDWPDVSDFPGLDTPPDVPVDHLPSGNWDVDLCLYLPDRMLFTPTPFGEYQFATVVSERIGSSDYTRPGWWKRDIEEFAEDLFPDWVTYHTAFSGIGPDEDLRIPFTDHADPAVFVPYVRAVAQQALAGVRALVPGPPQPKPM
ncbi:hypothetical protein SAMN05216266_113216 [Amycolatopsis marina]|uniref:Uncharacterized protein n=2 Tax=Amycolatopsis marina TaxID=490629 RepID=A0A1I1BJ30_9PSEU|nr:hypothetical protein SAMN05216266_113216 [Amycolatopsis marina]